MPIKNNKDRASVAPAVRNRTQNTKVRDRRVQTVRVLLEDSFHLKIGLREMGRQVNLSPWRLAHLFKLETGMSPQRYLTLVRLQRAKDQLVHSYLSVQEIGIAVGIPNPSHFTRSFKAAYGMTPIEYRRINLPVIPSSEAVESSPSARAEYQLPKKSYAIGRS
jgi:transcriptional regulator GlxA family with amidase domain